MLTTVLLGRHGNFRKALQDRDFRQLRKWMEDNDARLDDVAFMNIGFENGLWLRRNMEALAQLDQPGANPI
jgi:hypothetical protein